MSDRRPTDDEDDEDVYHAVGRVDTGWRGELRSMKREIIGRVEGLVQEQREDKKSHDDRIRVVELGLRDIQSTVRTLVWVVGTILTVGSLVCGIASILYSN